MQSAGLAVEVRPTDIDETPRPGEKVEAMVARLSRAKVAACKAPANIPVIAADTLVSLDGAALGQPEDINEARSMLQRLSGNTHAVLTSASVRLGSREMSETITTTVRFRPIDLHEINTYLLHNDILDKAGAYAVQAGAASFIEEIIGPLDNVIGLPVRTVLNMIDHLRSEPMEHKTCA